MKNIKLEKNAVASLEQQITWSASQRKTIKKAKNSSLKIGLIANDRLYYGLDIEGDVVPLTQSNWKLSIKYLSLDFILVESCYQSITGDWFMAQSGDGASSVELSDMVHFAKGKGIPVVYWLTLDFQYIEAFRSSLELFDQVYCADDRAIGVLAEDGVQAHFLPPAVQPALFTRLTEFENGDALEGGQSYFLVFDDLVDMAQRSVDRSSFYSQLAKKGAYFFDSINQIWNSKVRPLSQLGGHILGTVPYQEKSNLFARSEVLGIYNSNSRTRTENQWTIVEAAASHMAIVSEPGVNMGQFQEFCIGCVSYDEFNCEIDALREDEQYRKRVAQLTWRNAVRENCFSNRVAAICNSIGVKHDWCEFPSAALVTPSYRSKFISRAIGSYLGQTYPNKEWVLVFNGPLEEYESIRDQVSGLKQKTTFVPSELHAGPCMNSGIMKAHSDYVFRMDDDDFYGPNYLLDVMLYTRVADFDVIGKSFRYFIVDGDGPIFRRTVKNVSFRTPVSADFAKYPKTVNLVAGCSQGGRKEFFIENPYSLKNFAAVDTQWIYSLEEKGVGRVLSVDEFNLLVDRRGGNDHTWSANMDKLVQGSIKHYECKDEVCFV